MLPFFIYSFSSMWWYRTENANTVVVVVNSSIEL